MAQILIIGAREGTSPLLMREGVVQHPPVDNNLTATRISFPL
jgi:hypothetical protein